MGGQPVGDALEVGAPGFLGRRWEHLVPLEGQRPEGIPARAIVLTVQPSFSQILDAASPTQTRHGGASHVTLAGRFGLQRWLQDLRLETAVGHFPRKDVPFGDR